jgi:predicted short-subunit dehydrogenase-like oxidoreductase (DUF2520 family)
VTFTPRVPPRLRVGVVGSGRVGAVLGAALRRVGHPVEAVSARTDLSRVRAEALLPGVPILPTRDVVQQCDLLLLTVPDDALASVAHDVADDVHAGQYVMHASGRYGVSVLEELTERGAIALAVHPVMTFTGTSIDLARLEDCPFGVTAEAAGLPVAEALVIEMGGDPVVVDEGSRLLYHAALAHGANHLVTLVAQTCELLSGAGISDPARLVAPLLRAALDNSLRDGDAALTGPVSRGDTRTLASHVSELDSIDSVTAETYRALARATAERALTSQILTRETFEQVSEIVGRADFRQRKTHP